MRAVRDEGSPEAAEKAWQIIEKNLTDKRREKNLAEIRKRRADLQVSLIWLLSLFHWSGLKSRSLKRA